jgi:hypothetical protein
LGFVQATSRANPDLTGGTFVTPETVLPRRRHRVEALPMDAQACRQYAKEMRGRYGRADRAERGRLLDEFTAVTGYHRKYAIALLGREPVPRSRPGGRVSRFDSEVVDALVALWRAADYPWSLRLAALLPLWMPRARTHLQLSEATERILLGMSARSIDRALRPHRTALRRRLYGRTKPGSLLKHQIPIRSERWETTEAGWCETDTVAHCGETMDGEFAWSVNLTDVASTWTETRAVLGKGQRFVVEALEDMRASLPFSLLGLDSDSGSEFINAHCIDWCKTQKLQFTRSRPYHKNDNAHVEQKNWTHVRKIFGWKRIDDPKAIAAMNDLYRGDLRLLMNYFQPSVKLVERIRIGSRVHRKYDKAKTPFERLVELGILAPEQITHMLEQRDRLDPFALSAAVEAEVRAILTSAARPARRKPIKPPSWREPWNARTKALEAERAATPVRTYASR